MKKKNPAAGAPISIRIADDLKRDLEDAALKLKMDTHQVMRLAMEVGLEHFTRIDHNLAKSILDQSIASQTSVSTENPLNRNSDLDATSQIALLNEDPQPQNIESLPPRQEVHYESGKKKKNGTKS